MSLINKKAVKKLLADSLKQTSESFLQALDFEISELIRRSVKASNNNRRVNACDLYTLKKMKGISK